MLGIRHKIITTSKSFDSEKLYIWSNINLIANIIQLPIYNYYQTSYFLNASHHPVHLKDVFMYFIIIFVVCFQIPKITPPQRYNQNIYFLFFISSPSSHWNNKHNCNTYHHKQNPITIKATTRIQIRQKNNESKIYKHKPALARYHHAYTQQQ